MRRLLACALLAASCATAPHPTRVDVRVVTDEADAVLNILDKRAAKQAIAEADWQRLFASEGFVRLEKREKSLKREFGEETIRKFVLSDELLAKRPILARVLADWKHADLTAAAQRALAYLPPNATIRAKIYPVIKPATNSFVFELDTDPAIFKYIEDEPRDEFERTMSHELHHVGFSVCSEDNGSLPPNIRRAVNWIGAFGEGFAVLAAAGGPDQPPQARYLNVWTEEMAKLDPNFRAVDSFLLDVAEGRLSEEATQEKAFTFFGMLGPWYTVGWKVDTVIEKALGREVLIDAMCHPQKLLATYSRAADLYERGTGEKLPRWSARLVELVSAP